MGVSQVWITPSNWSDFSVILFESIEKSYDERKTICITSCFLVFWEVLGQVDSVSQQIKWTSDFRFRIEQDWDSRKSDGTFRSDRSRLRYRFRFGLRKPINNWASFGGRLRTGNERDQQGPHVTIGGDNNEFGLVKIGLEQLYFKFKQGIVTGWLGKNKFPFEKNDELFWNDNVNPEGVNLNIKKSLKPNKYVNSIGIRSSHFIISSSNKGFGADKYLQSLQLILKSLEERLILFPSVYYFHKLGNIPEGQESYELDYKIFHWGMRGILLKEPKLQLCVDYYYNFENYELHDSISINNMENEKRGFVISAKLGALEEKGDWTIHLYYANLEKYSIVDYFAQNDWARWDYSSNGATGSRLSNFQGGELRIGHAIGKKFNLILRTYLVEELKPQGAYRESGKRIRLDLNIGF